MQVGMIELTKARFDVALALHACGNATDTSMAAAARQRAAYVAVPCCIGKLKFSIGSGSSFHPDRLTWTPRYVGARAAVHMVHGGLWEANRASASATDIYHAAMGAKVNLRMIWDCSAAKYMVCQYWSNSVV